MRTLADRKNQSALSAEARSDTMPAMAKMPLMRSVAAVSDI